MMHEPPTPPHTYVRGLAASINTIVSKKRKRWLQYLHSGTKKRAQRANTECLKEIPITRHEIAPKRVQRERERGYEQYNSRRSHAVGKHHHFYKLTCCQRGEDSGVRYRRAHVPEYGRAEDAGEAVVKEFHITIAQSPRQGAHEGEHDAHGAEGAPARVRYNVAQDLDARKSTQAVQTAVAAPWLG